MNSRLTIFLTVVVVLLLLVALNAASYVRVEREPDTELVPDRSTFNAGASGARAFYDYLQGSGRKVARWTEPTEKLLRAGDSRPATFVIIGETRLPFKDEEVKSVLEWVREGGRLVVVDRTPMHTHLITSDDWYFTTFFTDYPTANVRANDVETITNGAKESAPLQPSLLTHNVAQIAPSRYASRLNFSPIPSAQKSVKKYQSVGGSSKSKLTFSLQNPPPMATKSEPPPPPKPKPSASPKRETSDEDDEDDDDASDDESLAASTAPVVYFGDERGALLVDYDYANGRIVALTDPFIVANNGISRADNLQLAVNLVTDGGTRDGIIAFDEYHQGRGASRNEFFAYFEGTPFLWIAAQLCLVALAVVWSQSRRFARPLPAPRIDRRSNLEFVASMAELEQRARAYDLAIENIYAHTRRALARYAGTTSTASRKEIAERAAARAKFDAARLEKLMRECEDHIAGTPLSERRAVELARELRELENSLGLKLRSREVRQIRAHQAM